MSKYSLEQQIARFFRNGFKKHHFTQDVYDAFYIYSNEFIAHFDRETFWKVHFSDPQGFFDTIARLKHLKAYEVESPSNPYRDLLGAYARDYLARMDILDRYLEETGKSLEDLDDIAG